MTLPPNYLTGLSLASSPIDPVNSIDISAGLWCRDTTNAQDISISSLLTKSVALPWAPGSMAGGLDSGSVANNATYHLHAILDPATGASDAVFSLSATNPVLPSGFTVFRRIGPVLRIGGGNWPFHQYGDRFVLDVSIRSVYGAPLPAGGLLALAIPTGIGVEADLLTTLDGDGASPGLYGVLLSPDQQKTAPSGTCYTHCLVPGHYLNVVPLRIMTNTSGQIYGAVSRAGNGFEVQVNGWRDFL